MEQSDGRRVSGAPFDYGAPCPHEDADGKPISCSEAEGNLVQRGGVLGERQRAKPVEYRVVWQWRDDGGRPKVDTVSATNALRAARKVLAALKAEYADVPKNWVVLAIERGEW